MSRFLWITVYTVLQQYSDLSFKLIVLNWNWL